MEPTKWTPKTHTVSFLIRKQKSFDVDRNYQREKVWSRKAKQYLIDTILRDLDIGRIWVRVDGEKYFIVDGQQRLDAIWKFADNKFPLSEEYSSHLGGKYYRDLPLDVKERFDEYNVAMVYLLNMEDEEIRDIYRRINSGVPLNTAEKLNALPGDIVFTMRKLAKHAYFREVCQLTKLKRYRAYHVVAQIMLLTKQGITDISPKYLFDFFDQQRNLSVDSGTYKQIVSVLNYLEKTFDKPTLELRKPGWAITTYLLASYLLNNYVMKGMEPQLKSFFLNFYQDVNKYMEKGDEELTDFYIAISRGTTKKDNIEKRRDIMFKRFWEYVGNLTPLDPKRDFTQEERIAVFRKYDGKCAVDGEDLHKKPWHVHHKKPWIEGGPTTIDNAVLLCDKHHHELHSKLANS